MPTPSFAPIAIVGRACVLPGALSPDALWELVRAGKDALSSAPEDCWGLAKRRALGQGADRAWTDCGGYVSGFESVWDPHGFGIDAAAIGALDPLFHWVLHTSREALSDAGRLEAGRAKGDPTRTGAILGNLSFPTASMARYAAGVWLEGTPFAPETADANNRFTSGLPVQLLSRALGVGGTRFALDAACASSLYAIALACDALHEGRADTMLAGAVNRADDLFIHVGFCALSAMSKSGRSRPFHADADGLVPGEGCGVVVLRRLEDALAEGERILGVIRGVGLSNDGRGRGLLAPNEDGQVRAIRAAYAQAGLDPARDIDFVECHATGTQVGDATEIGSMRRALEGANDVAIGSLKANLGHLVTVAGAAGLMKLLSAMEHGEKPPTPHLDWLSDALAGAPFSVLRERAPWPRGGRPRRAGLSAFGFGGNDAHLVVEEWRGQRIEHAPVTERDRIAVVAVGAKVAELSDAAALASALALGRSQVMSHADGTKSARAREVELAMRGLRFPPNDLQQTIAQQTLLLAAARDAAALAPSVPSERAAAIVGMGCDPEVARWGARWRLAEQADALGWSEDELAAARDGIAPALQAATVVGTMPNIPANRLNGQLDAAGPSFTVSAEEASGLVALEVARRALLRGEIDLAYVGAVDLSAEPVHERAARAVLGESGPTGDAAVVLVVMREADAQKAGARVMAVFDEDAEPSLRLGDEGTSLAPLFGRSHAAWGLLHVAAGALSIDHGVRPALAPRDAAETWAERRLEVAVNVLEGERASVRLRAAAGVAPRPIGASTPIDGPVLRLPAHPAPPRVNAPERTRENAMQSSRSGGVSPQRMEPAPALVPVTTSTVQAQIHGAAPAPSARSSVSRAASVATVPSHAPSSIRQANAGVVASGAHRSASATGGAATGIDPSMLSPGERAHREVLARAAEHQRLLGALHKDFLAQQTALHEQFLAMRQRALDTLLGVQTSAPTRTVLPAPALPMPTQPAPATAAPRSLADALAAAESAPAASPRADTADGASATTAQSTAVTAQPQVSVPSARTDAHRSASTHAAVPAGVANRMAPTSAAGHAQAVDVQAKAEADARTEAAARAKAKAQTKNESARSRGLKPNPAPAPVGPTFDREALKIHAGGRISEIFGPLFAQQDHHAIQVRMPMEPMLLADRVVGIDATPGEHGKGTVWTETDVTWDSWYLHEGRMPGGILIESGQADLFLISYMGADFLNQGARVYRLLGCELTYHRSPPRPGETIRYDIHIDGHARQGDVRLFFFHYDCRVAGTGEPVITVRNGQAGFFTREELDDSAGILWKPETQDIVEDARVDPPRLPVERQRFTRAHLEAFAAGDPAACFGPAFAPALAHVRTPRIAGGRMLFFDRVDAFEPGGGPWKRGYLRATRDISPDDWFFPGHFLNDPCMPGTLMFEGCLQAMAFYLAAMGVTVDRDGWRFEPIEDETYKLLCRGQVVPESKELVYEIFVEEVHDGPIPMLYADLLCTVDGLGAFHARRMGLRLVPDWPVSSHPRLVSGDALAPEPGSEPPSLPQADPRKPVARAPNGPSEGFPFDYESLLACAWGRPSTAFGPIYERFDGTRRVARLPGPPYHFMSRVTDVRGPMGEPKAGAEVVVEYDVPKDAWYFTENGAATMPMAVLMEAALQPCGWLASYVGCALTSEEDLLFRNLDGTGTVHAEVRPDSGLLRTRAKLKSYSKSGTMIIVAFDVRSELADGTLAYSLDTVFGFFPKAAFEDQPGLPTTDAQRALSQAGGETAIDLCARPDALCAGPARLASSFLLMLDRVVHFDPEGGAKGLGALRAEKDVDPTEWFFKAHFFQDPVQPGSLGVEAMCQLLQTFMLKTGMHEGLKAPRFEPIAIDRPLVWKYRGQVVPKNGVIGCTLEVTETGQDERGVFAVADASLWVDGKRIYDAKGLAMRIVEGGDEGPRPDHGEREETLESFTGHVAGRPLPDLGHPGPACDVDARPTGRRRRAR